MRLRAMGIAIGLVLAASSAFGQTERVDFALHQADGDSVFHLSEAEGKFVALHFLLKTTCPYCIRHTHDVTRRAGELPDVVQVFIKPDNRAEIEQWSVRLKKDYAEDPADLPVIFHDPNASLAKQFEIPFGYRFHGQVVHYPALVLLGRDGKEVFRYVGKNNGDRYSFDSLKAKVAEVKREK